MKDPRKKQGPPTWPVKVVMKPGTSQTGLGKPAAVVVTKGAFYWR